MEAADEEPASLQTRAEAKQHVLQVHIARAKRVLRSVPYSELTTRTTRDGGETRRRDLVSKRR